MTMPSPDTSAAQEGKMSEWISVEEPPERPGPYLAYRKGVYRATEFKADPGSRASRWME